ncbi:Anamorsin [Entomophthora muscae]|uniref:Anamorsin n=1 Tax=Entomophthora muscae TaxID=34485 RepID=A0ACC2USE4_9FUNG|nr:Anamorsin [Entomophthora muscae]
MSPNIFDKVAPEQKVLLVGSFKTPSSELTLARENILKCAGSQDSLDFEQLERLQEVTIPSNKYDHIFVGLTPYDSELSPANLKQLISSLKPSGKIVYQVSANQEKANELESHFKLAGYIAVNSEVSNNDSSLFKFEACKPAYEVGASMKLSFKKKSVDNSKVSLWEAAEDELLNEDDLLEEEDFSKPTKDSLAKPDCGPAAKKKACKNCSCGLAEIEAAEALAEKPAVSTEKCEILLWKLLLG